jgi:hypothetical protein
VDAYRAALTVSTREVAPTDWAMTTFNLALVYLRRAEVAPSKQEVCSELHDADLCLETAIPALRSVYLDHAHTAEDLRKQIGMQLGAIGCT